MVKLAVDQYGDAGAPTLVIAHGLFGSSRNWTSLAKKFAEGRHVLAVDMRNHGESPHDMTMDYPSMAADLLEVIAGAGGSAQVIGHSMGGKAAMAAALSEPSAISALIVGDIAPIRYDHSYALYLAAMRGVDLNNIQRRSQADPMLAQALPNPALRAFILQNLLIEGGKGKWRLNLDALEEGMPHILGWPETPPEATYDGPALFYHGAASDYVTSEHARERSEALFPNAQFTAMDKAGHWLHAENPAEFFTTADRWLKSH